MRPTSRLLALALFCLASSAVTLYGPELTLLWQVMVLCLIALAGFDLWRVVREAAPGVVRSVDSALPQGVWREVRLKIVNPTPRTQQLQIHDFPPSHFNFRQLPFDLTLPAGQEASLTYEIFPCERGHGRFEAAQLLILSPLQMWNRSVREGEPTAVKVYPNFQAVAKYALLEVGQQLSQIGIHRRRRRGEGRDFHQLREFVQGDPIRQIDWKASSRLRKLIAREYRDERDQQVMFLVDCGRAMRARDEGSSHFDQALNAVLLMASVALRHGDAVGMVTFSGEEARRLAPRKGTGQVNQLLDTLFDIQPSMQTADFQAATRELLARSRKRSLVVMVTNIKDEDEGELIPALRTLQKHHLVIVASLRERILDQMLEEPVVGFDEALTVAGTTLYLRQRRRLLEKLQGQGVILLDVLPSDLPITMVNAYLDVKAKGLL